MQVVPCTRMRRTIDIAVAVISLLLLLPLLLVLALAVAIDSPGNPFYRGWRVGEGGRLFCMWKFRTMAKGAASAGCITGRNDRRVTRLGRLLRQTKLDELPQFVNLLWGDMTLVGPRPEWPQIVAQYSPEQRAVLAVKPGITGRVQLDAGDEAETIPEDVPADEYYVRHLMDGKLRKDLEYLRTRSFRGDLLIVASTAIYVLASMLRVRRCRTGDTELIATRGASGRPS